MAKKTFFIIWMTSLISTFALSALAPAKADLEEILTNEIKHLFTEHCPEKCIDVSVNVNSKTSVSRSMAEPGFEELSGGILKSTSVSGIEVKLLVEQSLSEKTKTFLSTVIQYWGDKVHAPIAVTFTAVQVPSKPFHVTQKLSQIFFPLFLLIAALAAAIGAYAWFKRRKGKVLSIRPTREAVQVEERSAPALLPEHAPVFSADQTSSFTDFSLAEFALHHTEDVKKILARWSQTPEGLGKAIQILKNLPINLRQEFKGVVGEKGKEQLRDLYVKSQHVTPDQLRAIHDELKREIGFEQLLSSAQIKEDDFFSFLEQFDVIKIVHLIKTEDARHRAMVLIQLDPEKRVGVFQSFSKEEQKKMAHELSRLDTVHGRQLKDLSMRLSDRACQLAQIDLRQTSGFETLVNLIEQKDDPEEFITELTRSDIKLGAQLKNTIVSLDLVEWLEDDELTLYLSQFTRDELVSLIVGRFEKNQDLIFPKLTPQLSEYVRYHLEEDMRKKITKSQMKKAEKRAYEILKSMCQNGELDIDEIHQRKSVWTQPSVSPVIPPKEV